MLIPNNATAAAIALVARAVALLLLFAATGANQWGGDHRGLPSTLHPTLLHALPAFPRANPMPGAAHVASAAATAAASTDATNAIDAAAVPRHARHLTFIPPPADHVNPTLYTEQPDFSDYRHPPGKCDELPPARIWSHSSQVPHGGSLGPLSPAPKATLMARTFHGGRQVDRVQQAVICWFAMVPAHEVDVVLVLDEGPMGEVMARCLLELAERCAWESLISRTS